MFKATFFGLAALALAGSALASASPVADTGIAAQFVERAELSAFEESAGLEKRARHHHHHHRRPHHHRKPHHTGGCHRDSQCSTNAPNAYAKCHKRKCIALCDHGYASVNHQCVLKSQNCTKHSCKYIEGGMSTCSKNASGAPTCSYTCDNPSAVRLGTSYGYKCQVSSTQPGKCSTTTCQKCYMGVPCTYSCKAGQCSATCPSGQPATYKNGVPYCS